MITLSVVVYTAVPRISSTSHGHAIECRLSARAPAPWRVALGRLEADLEASEQQRAALETARTEERATLAAAAAQLAQERTAREAAAAQLAQERAAREAAEARLARSLPEDPRAVANLSADQLERLQQRLHAATGVIAAALAEARRRERECVVCLVQARSVICMPCRHKAVCDGCFEQLRGRDAQCPICRAPLSLRACVTGVLNP
eukprot:tig00001127_g7162.t1